MVSSSPNGRGLQVYLAQENWKQNPPQTTANAKYLARKIQKRGYFFQRVSYPEHVPEVGISEAEGDVGDVEALRRVLLHRGDLLLVLLLMLLLLVLLVGRAREGDAAAAGERRRGVAAVGLG